MIQLLRAVAPALDQALERSADDEVIQMEFIETIYDSSQGRADLDPEALRTEFGPSARAAWDEYHRATRRHDIRKIELRQEDLGGFVAEPAQLDRWMVQPGAWVEANTLIALLTVRNRPFELRTRFPSYVDRLAAQPGHPLEVGALLLYLAPAHGYVSRREPLCTLANAAA